MTAAEHLLKENDGYSGTRCINRAAYRVGSVRRQRNRDSLDEVSRSHAAVEAAIPP